MMQKKEEFYENIETAMKPLKSQDIRTIMGDFNSKVEKGKDETTIGPFLIGERMKEESGSQNGAKNKS